MSADTGGPAAAVDWSRAFAARTRRRSAEVAAILAATPPGVLSLAGGFPHPDTFPAGAVDELVAKILRDDASALQYTPSDGVPGLRAFLAERQELLQGRAPDGAELLVTSGGMEAIALACQAMVDPGDVIAVEAPTYLGALMAFAGFEAVLEEIPMDEQGLQVDALAERLAAGLRPKLLYVIPEYQNPTGRTLPLARREALVELCRRHGVLILEDVAYREIAFDDGPPPSLWSLAPDVVVQAGTFSKIFAPGVRLGWAIGPRDVLAQMGAAKQTTDQCSNGFGQRIVEAYGRSGGFERQLPRSRELYAGHWRALEAALGRHLPEGCAWTTPAGGFFAWLTLPPSLDATALRPAAMEAGVTYVPGQAFHVGDGGRNALRLSFSYLSADDLDRAVARLAGVLRTHL
jgi:2-aminoadipate transaminase